MAGERREEGGREGGERNNEPVSESMESFEPVAKYMYVLHILLL